MEVIRGKSPIDINGPFSIAIFDCLRASGWEKTRTIPARPGEHEVVVLLHDGGNGGTDGSRYR